MKNLTNVFLVFFGVWGGITLTINSLNAKYFGLQNAMIAGLVDNRTFALVDQAIPGFNLVEGDETFRYRGNVFPMKQPGQTLIGALIYSPLEKVGIEWVRHYDYTSSIITMITSSLAVAISATILYLITGSYLAAFIFAFATIVWPYGGVTHHDILAMTVSMIAIYLAYQKKYLLAGIFSGLVLFFSMLPLTLPIGLAIAVSWTTKNLKIIALYALGLAIGLVPSLLFNYFNFVNPLLFPNLAGKVADTMPMWDIGNFLSHLQFYLFDPRSAIWAFSPILLFAPLGHKSLSKKSSLLALASWLLPLLLLMHICTQETFGGYQYGPRYLLPAMPLLSLLTFYSWKRLGMLSKKLFVIALSYSVSVALVGAITTVMYPMPNTPYAPLASLLQILHGEIPTFRMIPIGLILISLPLLYRAFKHVYPVWRLNN